MDLYKILEDAENLTSKIQEYSICQRSLWQKIPLLALNADGRIGYNDNYNLAYDWGFWAIKDEFSDNYYSIFVDLETGKLIDAFSVEDSLFVDEKGLKRCSKMIPARKEEILKFAFNLDKLDAKKIINSLETEAKQDYYRLYDPIAQEKWRNKVIKLNKLSEKYQRI